MIMKNFLLISLSCFFITSLYATDYYVDATSGNDLNNGTNSVSAWKTLAKISSFTFLPGDKILLKTNEVWYEQLLLNSSGANGNPIIVDQYGTGNKPIINGMGMLSNRAATVYIENAQYLEINNLEITNTNGNDDYQGDLWGIYSDINISGGMDANHIFIRNCYIHDVNGKVATKTTGGIFIEASAAEPSRYNDLRIENNVIENVGGLGIGNSANRNYARIDSSPRYASLQYQIRGNKISNTGRNNVIIRVTDYALVEYNTLANSSRYDTGHSIFNFHTENVVIQYNEAYGNQGPGSKDRGAYDADYNAKNTFFQYNYSHDNFWGFAIMKKAINENPVFRYNISENDSKAVLFYGFESLTEMTGAQFYNNTIYLGPGINVTMFGSGEHARTAINTNFYNNIFYAVDSGSNIGSYDSSSVNFKNNLFYNFPTVGTNAITADPRLINPNSGEQDIDWSNYPNVLTGYRLHPDSPCIDAGTVISNNGGIDFWGVSLYNGAPDIGACEFVTSGNAPSDVILTPSTIEENNSIGDVIGSFTATDQDSEDTHVFYLVSGTGDQDNEAFSIDSGQLFSKVVFDFETKNSYSIRVGVIDNTGNVFEKQLIINITEQEPEIVKVVEDSYVRGGTSEDTNYGSSTIVRMKESSNASFTRRGYMKFNLSGITGTVETAQLFIYGKAQQIMDLGVYSVTDDDWSENSLTWNNAPVLASSIGSVSVDVTNQWYSIEITNAVQAELSGDGTLSIGLSDDKSVNQTMDLFSKENSSGQFQAYLSIDSAEIEQDEQLENNSIATLTPNADAFVRDGNYSNTNYGSDPELFVKESSSGFNRQSFLKFDVSSLAGQTITSAKLVMEATSGGADFGSTTIQVKSVVEDSWLESGITWNNKPNSGVVLDSQLGSLQGIEWDITTQVGIEVAGDGILSVSVNSASLGGQEFLRFNSKETINQALLPKLIVEYNSSPPPASKDVFLVIGQSNTAGRAEIEDKDMVALPNVYLLNDQGQWEAAQNPMNKYSTIRKDLSAQKLGYAYTFGKVMNKITSEDIGLVVNARGGSNINDWQKGASLNYYGEALNRIQIALSLPNTNLKGILWHQGEGNRNDGLAYITKLEAMLNDFRTDLNMLDLPLIAGQISQLRPENTDFNDNVIPTLPSSVANTAYVKSDFLNAFDLTHFDSEAQRVLGGRYAAKMLELAYSYQIVTEKIFVNEDSYVRGGSNADNNYNFQTVLRVKNHSDPTFTRESFLKFDLSGISDQIIDAIMVVNGESSEGGSLDITFHETTDNWSESTITWNNKPATGNTLEALTVSEKVDTDYNVFLSEYAQETQASDKFLSVTAKTSSLGQFRVKSKESTSDQSLIPYLLVTTVQGLNDDPTLNTRSEDSSLNNDILLYPNPVLDILKFKNISEIKSVIITSLDGKVVARIKNVESVKKYGFNMKDFHSGLYIIRFLKNNGEIVNKKVILK